MGCEDTACRDGPRRVPPADRAGAKAKAGGREALKLTGVLEALKTAAATTAELDTRAAAVTPPKPSLDIGRKASLTAMIRRVLEIRPAGDVFGTNIITAEVNRNFRERLRRPVKEKLVSITLKRLSSQGELRQVRAGRPHHEALYARMEG